MQHIYRFLALVVGLAAVAASGPSFAQKPQGYVLDVSGNVTGQVGAGRPVKVEKGQTLVNNATITTSPQSYAVLKFEDGTSVLLRENTSFQIQNYTYDPKVPEDASAIFNLVRGGMRMITGQVTSQNRDTLKVATPLVTMAIRGTEFVATLVNPLFLHVLSGAISATNAAGTVVFNAGQAGIVTSSTTLGSLIQMTQVPPGVFQMPNFPLTSVAATIPPGTPVGGGVAGGAGGATAIAIGAIGVAGAIAASNSDNQSTASHH
jgi:FecR-like protein